MLTSSAFQTTMPLRPAGLPFGLMTPKFCWEGSALHGEGEPDFVPSTTTVLLSIPRRWMSDFVMTTAPKSPWSTSVGGLVSSSVSW